MYVQNVNGTFYENPRWETGDGVVECTNNGTFLFRKGSVAWRTGQKTATELGIRLSRLVKGDAGAVTDKIVNGKLRECTVWEVRITKPVPMIFNAAMISNPVEFTEPIGDCEIVRFKC